MGNNKKETLEEAAERFVNNRFTKQICGDESYPDIYASKESIVESHILFAKWQQEIMYNEEDMINFAFDTYCYISILMKVPFNKISENKLHAMYNFEQFKKELK